LGDMYHFFKYIFSPKTTLNLNILVVSWDNGWCWISIFARPHWQEREWRLFLLKHEWRAISKGKFLIS